MATSRHELSMDVMQLDVRGVCIWNTKSAVPAMHSARVYAVQLFCTLNMPSLAIKELMASLVVPCMDLLNYLLYIK